MGKHDPNPPSEHDYAVLVRDSNGLAIQGALVDWNDGVWRATDLNGAVNYSFTDAQVKNTYLRIKTDKYQDYQSPSFNCSHPNQNIVIGGYVSPTDIALPPLRPNRPPVPSRERVCGINMSFKGGIVLNTKQYGKLPWYPSALTWLDDYDDRLALYSAMRAAGDTHAIIAVPSGDPLYDEPGQAYSADKFGARDWTNGLTAMDLKFVLLVDEIIDQGFSFIITMDERMENSKEIVQLVMDALTDNRELYGLAMPGYDGVFYGWDPKDVMDWAAKARAIRPNCYLGLEHNEGHIPLGEGGGDYLPGGKMEDFDVVLGEMTPHTATTWQILNRMIKPFYPQPEQGADVTPTFYLVDSPRGPRYYCAFETQYPYEWVRVDINNNQAVQNMINLINNERAYLRTYGCKYLG